MDVRHTLICVFVLSLCGGNSVSAKLTIFAGAEGGNGSIECPLFLPGSTKFFCKDECEAEDILIKTDEDRAQSGRYSTSYRNGSSGRGIVSVTITHLIKSDSGRYRCGLGKNLVPDSYSNFEVRVLDASLLEDHSGFARADTEGENITFGCLDTGYGEQKFLCKGDCTKEEDIIIETDKNRAQNGRHSIEYIEGSTFGLYVTITEATTSDTGRYRCGYGRALSPDSYYTNRLLVLSAATTSEPNRTPPPFTTPVPSASTPTATTTHSFSTQSDQQLAGTTASAAATTSEPNRTHPPFTTPVPSASTPTATTTHSFSTQSDQQLAGTTAYAGVLLCVIVILAIAVIIMGLALMIICIQRNRPDGVRTGGKSDGTNMEVYDYGPAVHHHEDSTYQSLDPAPMDEDQTYSVLTHT